jgi:hypothetical protein
MLTFLKFFRRHTDFFFECRIENGLGVKSTFVGQPDQRNM